MSLCFRKFAIFIMWSFVFRSFTFHPFSHSSTYPLYATFPRLDKRILMPRLSCFRWSTLISSLFTVFVSSLRRSRDCLCLPRLFPLAGVEMNFSLYYPLFPLHGYFCRFLSVCPLLCNVHLFLFANIYPSLFSRILFAIRSVSTLLQDPILRFATPFWESILRLLIATLSASGVSRRIR